MTNNFMADTNQPLKEETVPYFGKNDMEIESGYPSESDAKD